MDVLNFISNDGTKVAYYRWENKSHERVKGIILILHGMAEHAQRYNDFSRYLVSNNFIVYACDLRGHGKTGANSGNLGHFHNNDWENIIGDIQQLIRIVRKTYQDLPLYLLGHSMGSLLARTCAFEFGHEFKGIILSGTTNGINSICRTVGLLLSKCTVFFYSKTKRSNTLQQLFLGNYSKILSGNKGFDWLSRDNNKVQEYTNDKYCGFTCTASFFVELIKGLNNVMKIKNLNLIPRDLPILIISGEKDPVGSNGSEAYKTFNIYKSIGLDLIELKLYKDCRHEVLNEVNRKEVYKDIVKTLNSFNK